MRIPDFRSEHSRPRRRRRKRHQAYQRKMAGRRCRRRRRLGRNGRGRKEGRPRDRVAASGSGTWRPAQKYDVIYSNAALHWLPDHETLFPALMEKVERRRHPRGANATQFRCAVAPVDRRNRPERTVARPAPAFDDAAAGPEPGFYHDCWRRCPKTSISGRPNTCRCWKADNPVKEWTKGTWLTRYLDVLEGPDKAAFEAAYGERVARAYPPNAAGQTLFPFRRLFMVAQRKA